MAFSFFEQCVTHVFMHFQFVLIYKITKFSVFRLKAVQFVDVPFCINRLVHQDESLPDLTMMNLNANIEQEEENMLQDQEKMLQEENIVGRRKSENEVDDNKKKEEELDEEGEGEDEDDDESETEEILGTVVDGGSILFYYLND